jgi:hypothetical protein
VTNREDIVRDRNEMLVVSLMIDADRLSDQSDQRSMNLLSF